MNRVTFVILCLEGAVLSFNVAASAAVVPSIAVDFGLSQFFVGRIIWLYMLPYGISALIYGPLIRLLDAKKIELFCILFFSFANLLAASAQNIYILFAARFLMGIFGASVIPVGLILIARHVGEKNRGRFIGIFFGATFAASLAGLFLSGIIHWRLIYLIPSLAGFATGILIYFYLSNFKEDTGNFKINYLGALKNKNLAGVFVYIFIISMLYHGVQQWLGVYFSSCLGAGQFLVSMLITLTSLSGIFGEVIGGHFADIIGRIKTINLGMALMVLTVFCLIFKMPPLAAAVIMIIWGFGWTLNHAAVSTVLTDLPKEFLNEAASLNSSVRFISGGLGAALSGVVMQRSFDLGFFVLGSLLFILALFTKKLLIK